MIASFCRQADEFQGVAQSLDLALLFNAVAGLL